ncbi:General secretion pathway protein E [Candidatus Competibacter denitrificans Run_A_D11]|jgi:general secretion pathway protein E|uniref:Type II secretion system protein E n=1 Tax=Candidatus Competibacter denitrificans Run_A_D11 TaxID=1400863 RepID=W6MA10_9GAMM|nr:type II secretion system ATPase GspE [Candidatus Competibacter denitrificans]CDI02630.1 General secretion pathway protein E [Candidatus Competibacter denitrificans Run_A_D11]HAS85332.1 type II secretion system protein GspE [Candidatus Competibacteraceae bacterium]HRC69587.1 type II secretion system ATPase GspE [Candidatus Competibacter denitrificans]
MSVDLGELLVEHQKLADADLQRARRVQDSTGEALDTLLVKLGLVSERDLAEAVATRLDLPLIKPADYPEIPVTNGAISARFLKESRAIPLFEDERGLAVAMANPTDHYVLSALHLATGKPILPRVGIPSELEIAFERLYGSGRSAMGQIVDSIGLADDLTDEDQIQHLKDLASEAPVIRLVNLMIARAVESRASDIHIEPFENRLKVRYRVDGVLREVESPPSRLSAAVISRIKIMAKLNIAERRLPQDGRIQLRAQGKEIDLRVSTVPTLWGESVVMRILDKASVVLDFETLGFSPRTLKRFLEILHLPHGIILVTGPTGSGKTTTLYTALQTLNTPERKILTVEDPVEYQLEGINQIQVKPQINLTFANALRSIVRQDPDVIMIGEMRDLETAGIAVQSALTGHLVLSTLHTNDAAGSVTRLLDMGVDDYLLTSTINGILAQRLVRLLCTRCREPYPVLPELSEEMRLHRFSTSDPITLYKAVGCEQCGGSGYRGRAAIMEFLVMSDPLRRLVLKHTDATVLQTEAQKEGMDTMYEDGLRKAVAGLTTIEEVLRVTTLQEQEA